MRREAAWEGESARQQREAADAMSARFHESTQHGLILSCRPRVAVRKKEAPSLLRFSLRCARPGNATLAPNPSERRRPG